MKKKWIRTDRPYGSEHMDAGRCGGRIRQLTGRSKAYEWSSWIGEPGSRVLHNNGLVRTKASAKRAAERSCARLTGRR